MRCSVGWSLSDETWARQQLLAMTWGWLHGSGTGQPSDQQAGRGRRIEEVAGCSSGPNFLSVSCGVGVLHLRFINNFNECHI